MANINLFQNYPTAHSIQLLGVSLIVNGRLQLNYVYIPGTIAFNNVLMAFSVGNTTAKTLTISFGLYSLNGSTLSLANSASFSQDATDVGFSWITLVTSATQNITPGGWYFGYQHSSSGNSVMSVIGQTRNSARNDEGAGGPFFRGWHATTSAALRVSIATSDLSKDGSSGTLTTKHHPLIIISA